MLEIEKDELFEKKNSFFSRLSDNETLVVTSTKEGEESVQISGRSAKCFFLKRGKNDPPERVLLLSRLADEYNIEMDEITAKQALKRDRKGRGESFLLHFKKLGNMDCNLHGSDWTLEAVEKAFRESRRFHGRIPQIADVIASVSDRYGIPVETLVDAFDIPLIKRMRDFGLPDAEVVLLYGMIPKPFLEKMVPEEGADKEMLRKMASLLSKGTLNDNEKAFAAAMWVAAHSESDRGLLLKIMDNPGKFKVTKNTKVEAVKTQEISVDALDEIKRIEKAYKKPGFKFSECVCNMKMNSAETDKYRAYILEGDDPRQVMLGYETNCCQHLGDAGETAMMHGLLNPKAGFFVIVNKDTGKLRAQAEVWESDEETVVFDNIEFADDTEIDQYKEVLGEWLLTSGYKNAYMGCGYNAMGREQFEEVDPIIPPVTARELYVMSYEEDAEIPEFLERTAEGKIPEDTDKNLLKLKSEKEASRLLSEKRIDYYDYVYSDVDDGKGLVWLKKEFEIADWFGVDKELQAQAKKLHCDSFENRLEKYRAAIEAIEASKEREIE